jgi:hypothetical protein
MIPQTPTRPRANKTKKDEPRFGTFSTLRIGDLAYLYGHRPDTKAVMLARANVMWVLDRSRYSYWDGKRFQSDISKAAPVLENMKSGAIYRSKLFEPNKGRDWVFIGCSEYDHDKVQIGVSAQPEGPFLITNLIDAFPLKFIAQNFTRCNMFPHPWAFKEEDGQLMITWAEGSSIGNVVAVKVQFAMTMEFGRPTKAMQGKGCCGNCVVS